MNMANLLILATLTLTINQVSNATEPTRPSRRDQLRIAVQQICPVSGNKLGEHGSPIKAKVGDAGEAVFYCCEACLDGKMDDDHWATIHANIARAQGICLIMKRPLPENPKGSIVNGQMVYVCCPPCSKKVAANATKYLGQLDERYANSIRQAEKDAASQQVK